MDAVDFRSDTVTWPTPSMRAAMAKARVGDDVYGDDPTISELEARAAAMVGKDAGLFVASGTMGNLVAIFAHATRADQVLLGHDAHCFRAEAGSISALGGVVPKPLPTDFMGRMSLDDLENAVSPDDPHFPRTRLVALENTYAAKQGAPIPPEYFAEIRMFADRHGLRVHLDGARLFNAAAALDVQVADLACHVDSLSFCLSKGLCAPVGSLVCGSEAFIYQARRIRKSLGGGMRQAGILAAAGLVALDEMVNRLCEDHQNAKKLACGLATIPSIELDPERVQTNMVFFEISNELPWSALEVAQRLREESNVLIDVTGERSFRAVTHYWIGPEQVQLLIDRLRCVLKAQ